MQQRKNQLATVLATKDLDIPLVFIATKQQRGPDLIILLNAILKYRKAKTIILSQDLPAMKKDNLQIISMPKNKILKVDFLYGAFKSCALYLYPAFHELPGDIYLEAAKFGVSIIASSWSSIKEYFSDPVTGEYLLDNRIEYVDPLNISKIKELVEKKIGEKFLANPNLWIYKRTKKRDSPSFYRFNRLNRSKNLVIIF